MDTELTLGLPGVITTDSKGAPPSPPSPSSPTASAASITTTTPPSNGKRSFAESIIDHQDAKWSFCFQKGQGQRQPPQDQIPKNLSSENPVVPSPKAQAVGWPPVRSFRKNALASLSGSVAKASVEDAVYVKVSMDGAPFLRKIHLNVYSSYHDLASSLENMFSAFTIGNLGLSNGGHMSESKLKDLLSGSEFVPTYEDKDGDWMLVGDVPWNMFVETCKRLRIMKASDAIGLAPASKGNRVEN